jgi:hypothetical protein
MDIKNVEWRKASRSSSNGGNCVEISTREVAGRRLVRDSKNPGGGVLSLAPRQWQTFVSAAKAGQFSLS